MNPLAGRFMASFRCVWTRFSETNNRFCDASIGLVFQVWIALGCSGYLGCLSGLWNKHTHTHTPDCLSIHLSRYLSIHTKHAHMYVYVCPGSCLYAFLYCVYEQNNHHLFLWIILYPFSSYPFPVLCFTKANALPSPQDLLPVCSVPPTPLYNPLFPA